MIQAYRATVEGIGRRAPTGVSVTFGLHNQYHRDSGDVDTGAAKGCESLNFEGSYLGQIPLV